MLSAAAQKLCRPAVACPLLLAGRSRSGCTSMSYTDFDRPEDDTNPFRDSAGRYAGYLSRAKIVLVRGALKAKRYVAYSSDFGESLRPVLSPAMVTASYALAGAYIVGDCLYMGFQEYERGASVYEQQLTVAHALIFQGFASLLIPMQAIHTVVHGAQSYFQRIGRYQRWGPAVCGLGAIPLLPLIDEPIEHAVDYGFDAAGILPASRKGAHH